MTDAVIIDAVRTPVGKHGGALAGVRPDDLAALVLKEIVRRTGLDPALVEEVYMGCANQAGEDNRNVARMALLLAGLPPAVPGVTVNRLCSSGLEAIGQGARMIACGEAGLVLAGGVECMTRSPLVLSRAAGAWDRDQRLYDSTLGWRFVNPAMQERFGIDSMPETAENLAREHGITREDQDAYACRSQQRAARAQAEGRLAAELLPVDVKTASGTTRVDADEHPRTATTLEALARLKPILGPGTTITAGNSSGINDGAGAVLLASEAAVNRHRLQPIARIAGMASAGVPPRTMGLGPVPAIRKLLARAGTTLADYDVVEINEAFAAQVLACTRELGLPDDAGHVNPNGGAIAYGHPLGASGARLAITAALELQRRRGRRALVSLCVGVGQGLALALESAG